MCLGARGFVGRGPKLNVPNKGLKVWKFVALGVDGFRGWGL